MRPRLDRQRSRRALPPVRRSSHGHALAARARAMAAASRPSVPRLDHEPVASAMHRSPRRLAIPSTVDPHPERRRRPRRGLDPRRAVAGASSRARSSWTRPTCRSIQAACRVTTSASASAERGAARQDDDDLAALGDGQARSSRAVGATHREGCSADRERRGRRSDIVRHRYVAPLVTTRAAGCHGGTMTGAGRPRGDSSAGRASAWHAEGPGFKSPSLHHPPTRPRTPVPTGALVMPPWRTCPEWPHRRECRHDQPSDHGR